MDKCAPVFALGTADHKYSPQVQGETEPEWLAFKVEGPVPLWTAYISSSMPRRPASVYDECLPWALEWATLYLQHEPFNGWETLKIFSVLAWSVWKLWLKTDYHLLEDLCCSSSAIERGFHEFLSPAKLHWRRRRDEETWVYLLGVEGVLVEGVSSTSADWGTRLRQLSRKILGL